MAHWRTESDFESDLREFSEIDVFPDENNEEPPTPSIAQWRSRIGQNTASIFDVDYLNQDEDVTQICSGRGRGGLSKIFPPGKPAQDRGNTEDSCIMRRIKQETGFNGYNELIETRYKKLFADTTDPPFKRCPPVQKARTPVENPSSIPSSMSGSRSGTPTVNLMDSHTTDTESERQPAAPLPLSVLRQRAKKKHMDKSISDNEYSNSESDIATEYKIRNGKENISTLVSPQKVAGEKPILKQSPKPRTKFVKVNNDDPWWNGSGNTSSSEDNTSCYFVNDVFSANYNKAYHKRTYDVQSDEDFPPLVR